VHAGVKALVDADSALARALHPATVYALLSALGACDASPGVPGLGAATLVRTFWQCVIKSAPVRCVCVCMCFGLFVIPLSLLLLPVFARRHRPRRFFFLFLFFFFPCLLQFREALKEISDSSTADDAFDSAATTVCRRGVRCLPLAQFCFACLRPYARSCSIDRHA
jgi:hypothetical protein